MRTMKKIGFIAVLFLIVGYMQSCKQQSEPCMPDASDLVGAVDLPGMVNDEQPFRDAAPLSTMKFGYWDPAYPNILYSRDVDTNGLPRYNRFRFRMEVDGEVLSDWQFKQQLLTFGGKPNGIKDYVPVWNPPSQGYYRNVIDTIIEPETGQTGYIYRTEWVSNQEAYNEYVDLYNHQKDTLEIIYRNNFFVQEFMWYPSFPNNANYVYAIYHPENPYAQRWEQVPYESISKWVSGGKWKTALPERVELKEVYYYYVYWSVNPYFRNQIHHWLAYKYLNR